MKEITLCCKPNGEWVIEGTEKPALGPYRTAAMALQIAAIELVSTRKIGPATLCVKDDYGERHPCKLIEEGSRDRCIACENSWATENRRPLPLRCPLSKAISSSLAATAN